MRSVATETTPLAEAVTGLLAGAPFAQMAEDIDRARKALTREGSDAVELSALLLLRSVHLQLLLLDKAARR